MNKMLEKNTKNVLRIVGEQGPCPWCTFKTEINISHVLAEGGLVHLRDTLYKESHQVNEDLKKIIFFLQSAGVYGPCAG